jgi:hypothetical protein
MTKRLKTTLAVPLVFAAGLVVARVLPKYILGEHDLPLVVDNGPIEIQRGNMTPKRGRSDKEWEIHHSERLKSLHAWSWDGTSWTPMDGEVSISGVSNIVFELYDLDGNEKPTMTIRRDPFWDIIHFPQKVRLFADVDFTWDGVGNPLRARNQRLRIHAIQINGAQRVCFRNDKTKPTPPGGRPCGDQSAPMGVKVVICTRTGSCPTATDAPLIQP